MVSFLIGVGLGALAVVALYERNAVRRAWEFVRGLFRKG